MRDILPRLRETISRIPPDALDRECVPVTAAVVADAIKEIEELRDYANRTKVQQRRNGAPAISKKRRANQR